MLNKKVLQSFHLSSFPQSALCISSGICKTIHSFGSTALEHRDRWGSNSITQSYWAILGSGLGQEVSKQKIMIWGSWLDSSLKWVGIFKCSWQLEPHFLRLLQKMMGLRKHSMLLRIESGLSHAGILPCKERWSAKRFHYHKISDLFLYTDFTERMLHWWKLINTHVKSCTEWRVQLQGRVVPVNNDTFFSGLTLVLSIQMVTAYHWLSYLSY